ncbi:hypothetical protein [Granulicella sibirica]|uniref:Uncharacterized protein n=1 Tax=Granulicella sibirica TaxID=2479048 RepID=A0A4Q0T5W0_9BACT|nr:hypothetical protein [Granulicella sibirica]RXH57399.1 protein of unknown function DUF820 [Granulicella sibirica]
MATAPLTSTESRPLTVEEYLRTSYRPDCDFVDGVIEERNLGEYEHSRLQGRAHWALLHSGGGMERHRPTRVQTSGHS